MTGPRHLQAQWDEEHAAQTAVRRARLAMAASSSGLRPLWPLALLPAWLIADRIIAGLVAAAAGLGS